MQIVITIDDIDYGDFVERYYPLVKDRIQGGEGMGAMLLSKLSSAPPDQVRKVVDMLPKSAKDELAVRLLNANKESLLVRASRLLDEQDLGLKIVDVEIRK